MKYLTLTLILLLSGCTQHDTFDEPTDCKLHYIYNGVEINGTIENILELELLDDDTDKERLYVKSLNVNHNEIVEQYIDKYDVIDWVCE